MSHEFPVKPEVYCAFIETYGDITELAHDGRRHLTAEIDSRPKFQALRQEMLWQRGLSVRQFGDFLKQVDEDLLAVTIFHISMKKLMPKDFEDDI